MSVHANIEPLGWESEYFQLSSAKLHFDDAAPALTATELDAFALVQAKIPAQRLELLSKPIGSFPLCLGLPIGFLCCCLGLCQLSVELAQLISLGF